MATAMQQYRGTPVGGGGSRYVQRSSSSGLADVLEVILDKGIVIDAYVRVSVLGIELLTVDARVVIASVDTYLRFAEAVNRLDMYPDSQPKGLPGLANDALEQGARVVVKRKLRRPAERVGEFVESLTGRRDDDREE
jgi:gas vesicle structural protein